MTVKDLETLFDYGHWADRKLFDVVQRLSPEDFTRTIPGSNGSVRNTLVHMVSAEWGWLDRCGGPQRGAPLDPADFPMPAILIEKWGQVETFLREFLATLRDEDLARDVEFAIGGRTKHTMPMVELLWHAANHGAHHRGQVSMRLRLLGHEPENFDLLLYFMEKRKAHA
jgi:uncharacterized damage-inducible protein DinB